MTLISESIIKLHAAVSFLPPYASCHNLKLSMIHRRLARLISNDYDSTYFELCSIIFGEAFVLWGDLKFKIAQYQLYFSDPSNQYLRPSTKKFTFFLSDKKTYKLEKSFHRIVFEEMPIYLGVTQEMLDGDVSSFGTVDYFSNPKFGEIYNSKVILFTGDRVNSYLKQIKDKE